MSVLIDDLDRCQPEKIREIVEAINFLVTAGECYIVLGMARQVVEYYLGNSFSTSIATMPTELLGLSEFEAKKPGARESAFANLYMQKLIQLQYNLREISDEQAVSMFENSSTPLPNALPSPVPTPEDVNRRPNFEAESRAVLRREHSLRKFLRGVQSWFMPVMGTALIVFAVMSQLEHSASAVQRLATFIHEASPTPAAAAPAGNHSQVTSSTAHTSSGASTSAVPSLGETKKTNSVTTGNSTNTTGAETLALVLPLHSAGESQVPSQLDAIRFGPSIFQILLLVTGLTFALWLVGTWWLVAIPEAQSAKDSESFVTALRDWTPVLLTLYKTPRGLKQYLNHVRFLAMLQRAQEPPTVKDDKQPLLRKIALFSVAGRNASKRDGILENLSQRAQIGFSKEPPIPDAILVALAAVESMSGLYEAIQRMADKDDSRPRTELSVDLLQELRKAAEDAAEHDGISNLTSFVAKLKIHREAFCQLNGGTPTAPPAPRRHRAGQMIMWSPRHGAEESER